ncbi:hypothetical protein [Spirosoma radiotolerans]|uniref:Lipoprotein n=1 Tax=Spirosoma radiotolerans TaxID=1379870 RepID=A0A0E3ZZF4_9BACT|nr:hypothetical protein [Spirosoma radiotolerans]AKD57625.1 hypothetical protein SD10_24745 [Spirosoma radiotolerans]
MKTLATTLLAFTTSLALAQHSSISRSINDDGKTLSIRIKGTVDDKPIDYDRTFDVSSLNKAERNALREHILDSLNVAVPEPPRPPVAPRAALVPRTPGVPKPPTPPRQPESIDINSSDQTIVSINNGDNMTVAVGGKQPYTKEVNYNSESGQLHLRYRFRKDGDDFTYDRTLDAQNKSQQERQRIIDTIEKEIGVPTTRK